jgi:hypothetical protein
MNDLNPQKIKELTQFMLGQAKALLEKADEFYPFGAAIDKNENINAVGVYWGEENPDSSEVLTRLEQALNHGMSVHDYLVAAIGLDVLSTQILQQALKKNQPCRLDYTRTIEWLNPIIITIRKVTSLF